MKTASKNTVRTLTIMAALCVGAFGCSNGEGEGAATATTESASTAPAAEASPKPEAKVDEAAEKNRTNLAGKTWIGEKTDTSNPNVETLMKDKVEYKEDGKGSGLSVVRFVTKEERRGLSKLKGFDTDTMTAVVDIEIEYAFDYKLEGQKLERTLTSIKVSDPFVNINMRKPAEFFALLEGNGLIDSSEAATRKIDWTKKVQGFHKAIGETPEFKVGYVSKDTIAKLDDANFTITDKDGKNFDYKKK